MNSNNIVLDTEVFKEIVGKLATDAPRLLKNYTKTAHLAHQLERLDLRTALQRPEFTIAVIGRMSSGKSLLLNTLLDTTVLPVGVNETTATVNWLSYATGDPCQYFRVHRRNGSTELQPLENITDWTDEHPNTRETKYLEFFVDSLFLKDTNFVDTPGTQTNKPGHETTTREFITAKLNPEPEDETLQYGGFASAILYVMGSVVAKEHNVGLLQLCGMNTRLPGSYPENSIAVFQKWDTEGQPHEDPLAIAAKHRQRLLMQLNAEVSEVLPTCPPAAIAARYIDDLDLWNRLATSGASKSPDDMEDLSQDDFRDIRARIMAVIPPEVFLHFPYWPVIRFAVRLAHAHQIDDGKALREAVDDASGIEKLKYVLQTRFIDAGHLLQASSILAKVAAPCETAQAILREIIDYRQDNFQQALAILKQRHYIRKLELKPVRELLCKEIKTLNADIQHARDLRVKLAPIQKHAESCRQDFDTDIISLKTLADDLKDALDTHEIAFLKRLFGEHGRSVRQRLGTQPQDDLTLKIKQDVDAQCEYWMEKALTAEDSGDDTLAGICEHAANRLQNIAAYIEDLYESAEGLIV